MTERLDRIEAILEHVAERQGQMQSQQDRMQSQQDRMQSQQDRFQQQLEETQQQSRQQQDRFQQQLEETQQQSRQQQDRFQQQLEETQQQSRSWVSELAADVVGMISSLAENQAQTQMQLDALSAHVSAYIAQSSAFLAVERLDRAEFRQQMLGLQSETRNILRELADRRQQP